MNVHTFASLTALTFMLAIACGTHAAPPPAGVVAQQNMGDMKGMDMTKKPAASSEQKHKGVGTVKQVDPKAGIVTLAHEPVKSMNWPSMTMGFKVKDKMLFDKLAQGKKVEFEFVQEGQDYIVTSVK